MTDDNMQSTSVVLNVAARVQFAVANSRTSGTPRRIWDAVMGLLVESALYRWLTREPEPWVVVVDLRETATGGPLLVLIDRVLSPVEHGWENSRLEELADTVSRAAADSRMGRLASVVLKPPEPPTENGSEERD
jgi:hypothetical protein